MWASKSLLLLFVLDLVKYIGANDQTACTSKTNTHKLFVYPVRYEPDEIPVVDSGKTPFVVTVDMDIWDITDVSLEKQDIGVDLILSITWTDPRLSVHPNITSQRLWHVVNKEEARGLWRPNLYYRNCKGCKPITLDSGSMSPLYMRKSDGMFWAQHRSLTRFSCSIDLRSYPKDHQDCFIQLYINSDYVDALIIKHAKQGDAKISSNMTLSEFSISSMRKTVCDFQDGNDTVSCLEIKIHFRRLLAYHLMTSYVPTTFIVIISWISFWIPVEVVPARIALGLTLLLTMATRLDQAQKHLPSVSYVKAIDVWMFACICMVCCSLLEFAISYYVWRVNHADEEIPFAKGYKVSPVLVRNAANEKITKPPPKQQKQRKHPDGTRLDRAARVCFPVSFVLFNLFYWSYYL